MWLEVGIILADLNDLFCRVADSVFACVAACSVGEGNLLTLGTSGAKGCGPVAPFSVGARIALLWRSMGGQVEHGR